MSKPNIIPVSEVSQIAEARRAGIRLAEELNWDETATGQLSIVLTEIATNLVKHARGGQIHLQTCMRSSSTGIEVVAFDRGPGIVSIETCLRDGYSTAATSGTGLGAIRRLANEFDIYSRHGMGTCLVARLFAGPADRSIGERGCGVRLGGLRTPAPGETECGDAWGAWTDRTATVILLADGLGHGPAAAEASNEAVQVLDRVNFLEPAALLEKVHNALRSTRGAAVAIAKVEPDKQELRFAGVGNISAMTIDAANVHHLISHNGTAGHNVRKFQEFVYPWLPRTVLVMHSDGITTSWRPDTYSGIMQQDPSVVAATLIRDASRGRDDACVLVARNEGPVQ